MALDMEKFRERRKQYMRDYRTRPPTVSVSLVVSVRQGRAERRSCPCGTGYYRATGSDARCPKCGAKP